MTSFREIYEAQCVKRGEDPVHAGLYRDLDEIWTWIESRPELEAALEPNRLCIAMPAPCMISNVTKSYYDTVTEGGQPLYFFDPSTDALRAEIINRLAGQKADPEHVAYRGGESEFVTWKLRRLEKRFNLKTWEEYNKNYQ